MFSVDFYFDNNIRSYSHLYTKYYVYCVKIFVFKKKSRKMPTIWAFICKWPRMYVTKTCNEWYNIKQNIQNWLTAHCLLNFNDQKNVDEEKKVFFFFNRTMARLNINLCLQLKRLFFLSLQFELHIEVKLVNVFLVIKRCSFV